MPDEAGTPGGGACFDLRNRKSWCQPAQFVVPSGVGAGAGGGVDPAQLVVPSGAVVAGGVALAQLVVPASAAPLPISMPSVIIFSSFFTNMHLFV